LKKIIYIGSAHPLRGGLSAFNERLATEFMQHGHDVTMYSFRLQYPSLLFPGKTQLSNSPAPENLKIRSVINSINPFNWIKVGREIKKQKPDLVIIKYWMPFMGACFGTILRIITRNTPTKVICIIDNIIPHEKRPGDLQLTRYFIKPVHAFVGMSQLTLDDLKQFDTVKPRLYNPHPLFDNFGKAVSKTQAKQQLNLDPAYDYLLFFGFIRDYKGLDWLLEAFADDRFRKFKLKLIIAGEYYVDAAPYQALIEKLKLENLVIQKNDFIQNEEVASYFSAADMVVQPYKDATQSGVTQIAYHFDKPMLVTKVGGLPEMVPDGKVGYVVDLQPKAIADALIDFYENKREQAFIEEIKKEKEKYTWDKMYATLMNLYADVNQNKK
jgi:D-inositol-3-phosphate glycosyltransferase